MKRRCSASNQLLTNEREQYKVSQVRLVSRADVAQPRHRVAIDRVEGENGDRLREYRNQFLVPPVSSRLPTCTSGTSQPTA